MRMHTAARVTAIAIGSVALFATTTDTASATVPRPLPVTRAVAAAAAASASASAGNSPNLDFAGQAYSFTEAGKATSYRTSFTVSRINCAAEPDNPLFTVADVNGTDSAGTNVASGVFLDASCEGTTTPQYTVSVFADNANQSAYTPVSPGDTILVRATVAKDSTTATYNDVNSGTSAGEIGEGYSVDQSFDAVEGTAESDYPRFYKPIEFTGIKVDKAGYGSDTEGFDQVDADGNVVISGGTLGAKGNSFTATWMGNKTNG